MPAVLTFLNTGQPDCFLKFVKVMLFQAPSQALRGKKRTKAGRPGL
jgi:hypothetical protein